ncbi:MAG: ROK family protein [Bacteroidales bacterium]|nr:ROK family protein [Bacteroidales bacterium]
MFRKVKILGIDIGGSGVKGAIVNVKTGRILSERVRISTPSDSSPESLSNVMLEIIDHLDWKGKIGVGFPGVIQNSKVITAANLSKDWIGVDIDHFLTNKLKSKVKVINDADAAALAEARFGQEYQKYSKMVVVTIGTGIGTSLIHNGYVVENTELGQIVLKNGKVAEKFVSAATKKKKDLSWKEWGERLNVYLQELYELVYPEIIIIGGGVSKHEKKYREYLQPPCKVKMATLKNTAGIIGAATNFS